MQKFLFYSFRKDVRHFFGVVWHPFCPSQPCCFAVREGEVFPMATRIRSSSKKSRKCFFSTLSVGTCDTFLHFQKGHSVLFGPFCPSLPCCFAVREGRFFTWRKEIEAVAETHAKPSFLDSTFSQRTFSTFSDPFCPSLPCCFAVREGKFFS